MMTIQNVSFFQAYRGDDPSRATWRTSDSPNAPSLTFVSHHGRSNIRKRPR